MLPIIPPRTPRSPVPTSACDAHAHVFGPYEQYPPAADGTYDSPELPAPAYLDMLDTIGFARGVLVTSSADGTDNRAIPLAATFGRILGQPRGAALRRLRPFSEPAADGTLDDRRR
jgi:hypothetical protein